MAFHFSKLGRFSHNIKRFADHRGMVPEAGDKREDFEYTTGFSSDFTSESWEAFVNEAVFVTKLATEAKEAHAQS
jgi:hypothetical protein